MSERLARSVVRTAAASDMPDAGELAAMQQFLDTADESTDTSVTADDNPESDMVDATKWQGWFAISATAAMLLVCALLALVVWQLDDAGTGDPDDPHGITPGPDTDTDQPDDSRALDPAEWPGPTTEMDQPGWTWEPPAIDGHFHVALYEVHDGMRGEALDRWPLTDARPAAEQWVNELFGPVTGWVWNELDDGRVPHSEKQRILQLTREPAVRSAVVDAILPVVDGHGTVVARAASSSVPAWAPEPRVNHPVYTAWLLVRVPVDAVVNAVPEPLRRCMRQVLPTIHPSRPDTLGSLSARAGRILYQADSVELLAIDPAYNDYAYSGSGEGMAAEILERFERGDQVFGRVMLDIEQDWKYGTFLYREVMGRVQSPYHGGRMAQCHNPRHAFVARKGGEAVVVMVCFECFNVSIFEASTTSGRYIAWDYDDALRGVLNKLLRDAGQELAPGSEPDNDD